jgi:hypothetical protein
VPRVHALVASAPLLSVEVRRCGICELHRPHGKRHESARGHGPTHELLDLLLRDEMHLVVRRELDIGQLFGREDIEARH